MKDNIILIICIAIMVVIVLIMKQKENKNNEEDSELENKIKEEQIKAIDTLIKEQLKEKEEPEVKEEIKETTKQEEYELPNIDNTIYLSDDYKKAIKLNNKQLVLGKDYQGYFYQSIEELGNTLIGGTSSSGKTTLLHNIITNIIMTQKYTETKLLLIDTKGVDLTTYNNINNLMKPVVTKKRQAIDELSKIIDMAYTRYELFNQKGVSLLQDYNKLLPHQEQLPKIIIVIEDISLVINESEQEQNILDNLLKVSNQAGIYVIFTTTAPTRQMISDSARINISTRISFNVTEKRISKLIIGEEGAEKIIGNDNFIIRTSNNEIKKYETVNIDNRDIEFVLKYFKEKYSPRYTELLSINNDPRTEPTEDDPLLYAVCEFAIENGTISASLIQRRFRLGYNRAAHIINQLEEKGIVGPQEGTSPRKVLIQK